MALTFNSAAISTSHVNPRPASSLPDVLRIRASWRLFRYPGGGGYTGYVYNVGYARAMLQAALSRA